VKVFKWALLVVVTVVVLTGCGRREMDLSADAEPVVQDSAPQQPPPVAVMATGKTVAADGQLASAYPSLGLAFGGGVSGRVLTITVRPGDVLQAGDLLALLDETELQRAVDDAQLALDRAIADRERARQQWERDVADGEQSLAGAERAVDDAQLALDRAIADRKQARQQWERDVADGEQSLAGAERVLEEANENLASVKAGPSKAQLDSAEAAVETAEENYEKLLSGSDPVAVEQAKLGLGQARNSLWNAQLERDATNGRSSTPDYVKKQMDIAVVNAEVAVRLAEISYQQAQESATTAEIANAAAQVQQAKESLEELRNSPTSLYLAQAETQVTQAEYNLARAERTLAVLEEGIAPGYERAVEDAERALASAQENMARAERAVAAVEAGLAPGYERAVEDAERALARAQETLIHARLTAPWAAIVLSVNVAPEATIGQGTPVVTLLDVEDGLLFVTQNLGEQHVADVYVGQRAVVALRTFADEPLEGTVEAVVPQDGGTQAAEAHFTVRVRLSPTDLRLLPGLTGRVEIFAGE